MKRSFQEIVELTAFGVIALVAGTGLLWLLGHILRLVSWLAINISKLLWIPLKYVVVLVIIAIALYFIYKLITGRKKPVTAKPAAIITNPGISSTPSNDSSKNL